MAPETASPRQHSNSYNIFILVLTVLSLVVMVVMLLPIACSCSNLKANRLTQISTPVEMHDGIQS